jgi:ferric-dicitrate binding protein FerR (iron transport regulator)
MDELLVKYLLGETSTAENHSVLQWINAHPDNKRYFDHFKIIWSESKNLEQKSTVDENKAWERFKQNIAQQQAPVEHNVIAFEPRKKSNGYKIAAAVALLIIGSFAVYFFNYNNADIVLASSDKVLIDTLPDGSVITLNKNSTLAYAKNFNTKTRNVKLTGEAFFNVTPNKQKPFEITVDEVKVHVVGTSFNIKSTTESTEVIVETGIVKVGVENNAVKLLPKQKILIRKNNAELKVQSNLDDLYNYYHTKKFVCNNTPLYQLTDALSNAYNTKIIISGEASRNLRLTTTFKEMSLNDILKVITETFNLKIEQRNGEIILK